MFTLYLNKIIDLLYLKACRDCNLYVAQKIIVVFEREEKQSLKGKNNIVGKGENAGDQHFLLFPQCFQNLSSSG